MPPKTTRRRQLPTIFYQSPRNTKGRQGVGPTINPRYAAPSANITRAPKTSKRLSTNPGPKPSTTTPAKQGPNPSAPTTAKPPQAKGIARPAPPQASTTPGQVQAQQQPTPGPPVDRVHLWLAQGVYAKISRRSKAKKLIRAFCKLGQHKDEHGLVLHLRGKKVDRNTRFVDMTVGDNDHVEIGWPANPERTRAALKRAVRLIHEKLKGGQGVQTGKA